jgi:hypothetical protein
MHFHEVARYISRGNVIVRVDVVHALDPRHDGQRGEPRTEQLLGERPRRDPAHRFARRSPPAPLPRAQAILRVVGEVGVARPIDVSHIVIGRAAGVFVAHHHADGRAERAPRLGIDAGEDLDDVVFFARRDELALPRPAARERRLDRVTIHRMTGRTPIDHATHRGAMALTERRHAEGVTQGVSGHRSIVSLTHRAERATRCGSAAWAPPRFYGQAKRPVLRRTTPAAQRT